MLPVYGLDGFALASQEPFKVSIWPTGCFRLRINKRPKNNFSIWALLTPKSRFKVPASATPNHVDRETVPAERGLVREWAVTSFQESRAKFVLISPVLLLLRGQIGWQTMSDRCVVAGCLDAE